jgi:cardiolipin synthase (CMP-forming)
MLHVPNILTLLRVALIPIVAYFLMAGAYAIALPIFLVAALTDLADGYIARRFRLTTRLGATLDPIADKMNMLVATLVLAWQGLLPLWLAMAIIGRDILIVAGALAYHLALGHIDIAPTMLSKINTALEFALLLLVMTVSAGWIAFGSWMPAIFAMVFVIVIASGVQYAWVWGRKAIGEMRSR